MRYRLGVASYLFLLRQVDERVHYKREHDHRQQGVTMKSDIVHNVSQMQGRRRRRLRGGGKGQETKQPQRTLGCGFVLSLLCGSGFSPWLAADHGCISRCCKGA